MSKVSEKISAAIDRHENEVSVDETTYVGAPDVSRAALESAIAEEQDKYAAVLDELIAWDDYGGPITTIIAKARALREEQTK